MATRCIKGSLLPYLKGGEGGGSVLLLSLDADLSGYRERAYPFMVRDDSDSVSRLVEARFVTDNGCTLRRVYLQIQKDQYTLREDEPYAVTNLQLDAAWQSAFSSSRIPSRDDSSLLLAVQTDEMGRLAPLAPLFFCRERQLFFHPVCPTCGLFLELCSDDPLLIRHGLPSYSGTARRFLSCKSCTALGTGEFYLFEREATDPVSIRDRWALLDRFRFVTEELDPDGLFPCVRCPEHERCYGQAQEARQRITPFSFYPFYLLIHDAPTFHLLDFVQLAAGATAEELQRRLSPTRSPGRIETLDAVRERGGEAFCHFPGGAEQSFPALLLLKLSLVREFLHRFQVTRQEGVTVGSENLWVHRGTGNELLPLFGDVHLEFIVSITPLSDDGGDAASASYARAGTLWFQILLQNGVVSQGELLNAVRGHLLRRGDSFTPTELQTLARPENLYWNPAGKTVPKLWLPLWEKACDLGYLLLDAALSVEKQEAVSSMAADCDALIMALREALFAPPTPYPPVQPALAGRCNDRTLREIVSRMIVKCQAEVLPTPLTTAGECDDEAATVIITPRNQPEKRRLPPEDDMITETVLLTPQMLNTPVPPRASEPSADDRLLETMVIRTGRLLPAEEGGAGKPLNDERESDRLGETIIVGQRSAARQTPVTSHDISPDVGVGETVIMTPGQAARTGGNGAAAPAGAGPDRAAPEQGSAEDDLLGETVVIMPPRRKIVPPSR